MGIFKNIFKIDFSSKFRDYGIRMVGGSFGVGKTKNIFQNAFLWKKENPNGLLIANVPYDFVDIHYSSKDDLNKLLAYLKRYIEETNLEEFLVRGFKYPIKLIIDEGQLYYSSRDYKTLDKEIMLIMTQCRKRRISIDIITQEIRTIDVFIRNLSPYVYWYVDLFLGFSRQILLYIPNADTTNVSDPNIEKVDSEIIWPDWIQKLFNQDLKRFFMQKFLTLHVIGLSSTLQYSYDDFINKLDIYGSDNEEDTTKSGLSKDMESIQGEYQGSTNSFTSHRIGGQYS